RPYDDVPAYLQHADVIVVPHVVSPFTESLDPIKAYECLAVDTPTVATPVAGFRDRAGDIVVAPRERFCDAVRTALAEPQTRRRAAPPSWRERAEQFASVLEASAGE
ncbi:MAG: glycosyltransferase, partial [Acidimicrobiales bacterium]